MSLYLGLISGTSMDAIDAALVDFDVAPPQVVATSATAFDPALKRRITSLMESAERVSLDEIGQIDVEVAQAFARAAIRLMRNAGVGAAGVTAIGSHGQTLRHRPDLAPPFTWQIGDPNTLVEMTGITVVGDFRRRDVAAGGQGAPLLPVFHDQVFRSADEDRVIVNVGGIANITILRRGTPLFGFDTGPGNRLLDAWIARHRDVNFDADGAWAGAGRSDADLLRQLLDEPYLALPPPKSTGRELFNLPWLAERSSARSRAGPRMCRQRCSSTPPRPSRRRRAATRPRQLSTSAAAARTMRCCWRRSPDWPRRIGWRPPPRLGLDPDYVEAVAFAWFARRTLAGLPSSAGSVTGARGARILGGVYRHD